jgi:Iron-containing redox enzyme
MSLKYYVIEENRAVVRDNPVILALRNRALTAAQFKLYAAQRACVATNFIGLVHRGLSLARLAGDAALAAALQSNLDDEAGIGVDGIADPDRNHRNWKIAYLNALGLGADRADFPLLDGTRAHVETFLDQERIGTGLVIAGMILSLENIIPLEYRAAQIARDHLFPEIFCLSELDMDEIRADKRRARQYIDDHIIHDAKSHFPDLLSALVKYEDDLTAMAELRHGIDIVNACRKNFYTDLETAMRFDARMIDYYTDGRRGALADASRSVGVAADDYARALPIGRSSAQLAAAESKGRAARRWQGAMGSRAC